MAERIREITPAERVHDIASVSDAFTYAALTRWFNELRYTSITRNSIKNVATADGAELFSAKIHNIRTVPFGGPKVTTSAKIMVPLGPVEFSVLRGRTLWRGMRHDDSQTENLDYINASELAWRKKAETTFELIALGTYFGTTTEPAIATIQGREKLTTAIAEEQVVRFGQLVLEAQ